MAKKILSLTVVLFVMSSLILTGAVYAASKVTLRIESWRNDDILVWQNKIIPAFQKKHPNIEVKFQPSSPPAYNSALNAKLAAGTAGDLITCRPFNPAKALFDKKYLISLKKLKGMKNFTKFSQKAWSEGSTPYCMPMASVIHGFIYNADLFDELGLKAPKTEAEFFKVLETIKKKTRTTPLAMGTADQWEAATMGFQNIGPNYWKGEKGRQSIIDGTGKMTDRHWVEVFETLGKWGPYLGRAYKAQSYPDSQSLFTMGRAAIYPAGSWEIGGFNKAAEFKMGAFYPPVKKKGDKCYISDELDMGMGINSATKHMNEAKTFLNWMATSEFATIFNAELPGFFALSSHSVKSNDPLVKEFLSWRKVCDSTLRSASEKLNAGNPNLDNEIWATSSEVINGTLTPMAATNRLQSGLEKWYAPQQ